MGCSGTSATVEAGAGAGADRAVAGAAVEAAAVDAAAVVWFGLWPLLLQPATASAAPIASAIGVSRCLCMDWSLACEKSRGRAERAAGAADCASVATRWRATVTKVMAAPQDPHAQQPPRGLPQRSLGFAALSTNLQKARRCRRRMPFAGRAPGLQVGLIPDSVREKPNDRRIVAAG